MCFGCQLAALDERGPLQRLRVGSLRCHTCDYWRAPRPAHRRVLTASQLIAERMAANAPQRPGSRANGSARLGQPDEGAGSGDGGGFDWCASALRSAGHPLLAAEVALSKAGRCLVERDVEGATGVFKAFEHKESALRCGMGADTWVALRVGSWVPGRSRPAGSHWRV